MASLLSSESLARGSARRPWITIGVWVLALVLFIASAATLLADALVFEFKLANDADSVVADKLIEERHTGPQRTNEIIIVRSQSLTVDDEAFKSKVESTFQSVTGLGDEIVESGVHYYLTGDESLVSSDRRTTLIPITMAGDSTAATKNIKDVREVLSTAGGPPGFELLITGQATAQNDLVEINQKDSETGESIAIPIALLILVVVFGALVAAVVPVIIAVISIAIAMGLTGLFGLGFEFSAFVTNIIIMLGLAVGIDYSLFIVYRFRTERNRGLEKQEAIARAGATASRAVFFSGMIVVLALLGLLLIPMNVYRSLAAGAIFVVVTSVLASLTLLPAVLSLLGDKVNRLRVPIVGRSQKQSDEERLGGFWDRIAHGVMGQPVLSLVLAGGLLVALSIPFFDMTIGIADVSTYPDKVESKQGFAIVSQEFPDLLTNRVRVVIDGPIDDPTVQEAMAELRTLMEADDNFGATTQEANASRDLAVVSAAVIGGDAASRVAIEAIKRLRRSYVPEAFGAAPARALVAGDTAFWVDFYQVVRDYAPIIFAFVLGMSFLLLTIVFRSIVVSLKSIVMNLLSVGAAYGIIVLVFQKGIGNELLGFQQVDVIMAWLPLFLFAILFGLSMDYHVFLLSRMRERFDQTQDNAGSVAFGIRTTGRLITGAALIMVAVFSGFAFSGSLVDLQQFGFGMGVAILLDAHHRAHGPGAFGDEAAGGLELVPAQVVALAARHSRRCRPGPTCTSVG